MTNSEIPVGGFGADDVSDADVWTTVEVDVVAPVVELLFCEGTVKPDVYVAGTDAVEAAVVCSVDVMQGPFTPSAPPATGALPSHDFVHAKGTN